MTVVPSVAGGRWRRGVRFFFRTGRRTLVETLYLLTGPVTAAAGLLLVSGALCLGTLGLLVPRGVPVAARALMRWSAHLERWRIAVVRRQRTSTAGDPRWWLGVVHAIVVPPIAMITCVGTGLWLFVGVGSATSGLRSHYMPTGRLPPMTLNAGDAQSHVFLSVGLTSAPERIAVGTAAGLLLLCLLPLLTRICVAVQAGLGKALLSDTRTVPAVTVEATAMRRLERDIHDGPQQRLVRLAMELGRAQHHFDSRPDAVRAALAEAIVQTRETLDELRALSRGIAPPVLVDRGLRAAVTELATLSSVPVTLDADPLDRRPAAAVETTAYFVIAEALTNVAKHSQAGHCVVRLRRSAGTLRVSVTDDGVGGAAMDKGHGLRGLADRVHAAGGRLRVISPDGGPTSITADLPCR